MSAPRSPERGHSELQRLAALLDFEPADLAANRAGRLSEAQHARFARAQASMHRTGGGFMRVVFSACIAMVLAMLGSGLGALLGWEDPPLVLLLLWLPVSGGIGYLLTPKYYGGPPPAAPAEALSAGGYVHWSTAEGAGWGADSCYVHVGDVALSVTGTQQRALTEGGYYRVYYTRTALRIVGGTPDNILSAEPLDAAEVAFLRERSQSER